MILRDFYVYFPGWFLKTDYIMCHREVLMHKP